MALELLGHASAAHHTGKHGRVRGVGRQFDLVQVEVVEKAVLLLVKRWRNPSFSTFHAANIRSYLAIWVTDQRKKSVLMVDAASLWYNISTVNELDRCPNRNCRKGVENFLENEVPELYDSATNH